MTDKQQTPMRYIFGYAVGEGAISITMNGISGFAMLYYTQVLGLSAVYVGIALGVSTFWDAITAPIMGHITDNTRSRYGNRHPYILVGGAALAAAFYFLWNIPDFIISGGHQVIFWYVLLINLIIRTADTVFLVPYVALGFEICTGYAERSKLQGVRCFLNQMVNFMFGAMAWTMFFHDSISSDGSRLDGTKIEHNYIVMSVVLSAVALGMVLFCIWCTRRYMSDNRQVHLHGNSIKAFLTDMLEIMKDKLAVRVFIYFGIAIMGMQLVAQLQMFTYVNYMQFTSVQKTIVHGAGMLSFGFCAFALGPLVRRWDKKPVACIASVVSITGGVLLYIVFIGGMINPTGVHNIGGINIYPGVTAFMLLQMMWHGGNGMLIALATSMIADISGINQARTGDQKDGSYSAVFSFFIKASCSVGLFITGVIMDFSGFIPEAQVQSAQANENIAIATFLTGPLLVLFSLFVLKRYPVTRSNIESFYKSGKAVVTQ